MPPSDTVLESRKALIDAAVAVESARGSDPHLPDLLALLDERATEHAAALTSTEG